MDTITRLRSIYAIGRPLPQWQACCNQVDALLCYNYPLAEGYDLWQAVSEVCPSVTLMDLIFIVSNAEVFDAAYGIRKGMRVLLCTDVKFLGMRGGFVFEEIAPDHYEIIVVDGTQFLQFLAGLKTSLTMTIEQDTVVINALPTNHGLTRSDSG